MQKTPQTSTAQKASILALIAGVVIISSFLATYVAHENLSQVDQTKAACDISRFTIQNPTGYTFNNACMEDSQPIYSDDTRFTYFLLSEHLRNIPFVRTGNVKEKDDKNLSWSISINKPSIVYIMYRKIPGQTVPVWISSKYVKSTLEGFTDLNLFAKRKNNDGLIGLYDVYMTDLSQVAGQNATNLGITGTVTLGPASTVSTTAYSMYIVAVAPVQ